MAQRFGDGIRSRWHSKLEHMPETTKAYLCGLIDGEAYVHITKNTTSPGSKGCKRGYSYRMGVDIRMTDRRPLDFILEVTGIGLVKEVKLSKIGNRKPWRWTAWSQQAAALLMCLVPYLIVKKEQAEVCIRFQEAMRFPGPKGLTNAEWELRDVCWRAVKDLNYGSGRGKRPLT